MQITGLEEDVLSKPYRPIPSGRITVSSARILHYFVICVSALLSIYYDTVLISIAFFAMNYLYNECTLARYWPLKSFFAGYGYACLMAGAACCLRTSPYLKSAESLNILHARERPVRARLPSNCLPLSHDMHDRSYLQTISLKISC